MVRSRYFLSLSFFLSGRYFKDDGYIYGNRIYNVGDSSDFSSPLSSEWYTNPTGDSTFVSMNSSTSYSFQGSLKYQLSDAIKLLFSGSYNNREYREYDHEFRYNPDGDYKRFNEGRLLNLSLTHVLSQRYILRIKSCGFSK